LPHRLIAACPSTREHPIIPAPQCAFVPASIDPFIAHCPIATLSRCPFAHRSIVESAYMSVAHTEAPRLGAQPRLRSLQQTANANGSLGTARSCGCRAPRLHPGTPNNNCIFSLAERLRRAKHPKSNRSKVTPIPKVQAEQQLHTFMSERLRRATHPDSHRSRATPTPKVQAEQHLAWLMGKTIAQSNTVPNRTVVGWLPPQRCRPNKNGILSCQSDCAEQHTTTRTVAR
jgi:hypothetical protein